MTPPENLIALLKSQLWCEVRPIIDFMRQLYNLNQVSRKFFQNVGWPRHWGYGSFDRMRMRSHL